MSNIRAKFEHTCRANSVVCEYLSKCKFVDNQYVLIDPVPHHQYMADRLTGAWWAFQEQEKVNLRTRGSLKVEIAHLKIELDKKDMEIKQIRDKIHEEGWSSLHKHKND